MAITASMVKELRERTGAGMMECKKALTETNGDIEAAIENMRKSGQAKAAKKAGRTAADGVIVIVQADGGRRAAMVEVNCETDFAARSEDFQALVRDVAMHVAAAGPRFLSRDEVTPEILAEEQEIARETTLGLQYYLERMQDYSRYRDNLPAGSPARDHNRHVLTIRFTRLALQQDLILSVFHFYSPSDEDGYLRAGVSYRLDDNWVLSGGLNHFYGDERHTFFGQLEKNSNVYTAIHYGFGSW